MWTTTTYCRHNNHYSFCLHRSQEVIELSDGSDVDEPPISMRRILPTQARIESEFEKELTQDTKKKLARFLLGLAFLVMVFLPIYLVLCTIGSMVPKPAFVYQITDNRKSGGINEIKIIQVRASSNDD